MLLDARHKNLISRTLWIGQQKLFFVFLVVNKLLYWLRAPHAMPPSITFLVLFGIKYGDWLDSSGDYTVRTWVAPVFTLCSDINIIIISVSPNHIIIDLDLIRAPGFLWADSEARQDRQRLHFLNSSGLHFRRQRVTPSCWNSSQTVGL